MRVGGWQLAFGVGHFLNDVCATVWFSYTLLYFQRVLCFPSHLSGAVVLTGQVADGLSTVFVGVMADRDVRWSICRYGKRKLWHLLGTVCVICTFAFIFSPCLGCSEAPKFQQLWYYLAFAVVFQFGWAAVQIAHLALIPSLTTNQHERTELNALRYGFTVTANILVYAVAWVVLGTAAFDGGGTSDVPNSNHGNASSGTVAPPTTNRSTDGGIGPSDVPQFRIIILSTMAVGIVTTLVFHIFTKEPVSSATDTPEATGAATPAPHIAADDAGTSTPSIPDSTVDTSPIVATSQPASISQWLKRLDFWMLSVIYMSVRLYVNLSMTYITLYLHDFLQAERTSVAVVPLTMYVGGFCGSLAIKLLSGRISRRSSLAIGALLGLAACTGLLFGTGPLYRRYLVYPVALLLGTGGSIMLVTALAATSDIIGSSVRGAFVYGALSFCDKLSNGLVVEVIQNIKACTQENALECGELYQYVLVVMCGGACIVVLFVLLVYRSPTLWHPTETDVYVDESSDPVVPSETSSLLSHSGSTSSVNSRAPAC